ncbi:MAG: hypothetical protein KY462_12035 [Actinobacteria bacterium]|nr:hypothetical protein [Actinomycetota bacterium]
MITVAGLAFVAAWVMTVTWSLDNVPYDIAGAVVTGPFLLAGATIWAVRAGRRDGLLGDWVLPTAVVVRLVSSIAYLWVFSAIYDGVADAFGYSRLGGALADRLGQGLVLDITRQDLGGFTLRGTGTIIVATAALFALLGESTVTGFLVFALAGICGHWLMYRAYRLAEPDANARPYGLLVLFFPSLVFWTSPIGKEAWFALFLGIGAYGVARILIRRPSGYLLVALGSLGMALVRPHVAAMFTFAVGIGVLRHRIGHRGVRRPLHAIVIAILVTFAVVATVKMTADFLNFDPLETEQVIAVLERTSDMSGIGGSQFEPVGIASPRDLPAGTASVLFRPFPTEADNPMMLLAAGEGVVLMGLLFQPLRRPSRFLAAIWGRPYVAFAAVFVALFVVGFSYIGNFGILVRQRTMMLPFLFVLILSARDRRVIRS